MHVFISPHPDDAALSCGGRIARLRDRGELVAIVTVFSGAGAPGTAVSGYQRAALGIRGAAADADEIFRDGSTIAAARRAEDARYAGFVGAAITWLDLPDAVYRGYESDAQLLSDPLPDERPPVDVLRRALGTLGDLAQAAGAGERVQVHAPLGVGGHVDHVLCRDAAIALLPRYPDLFLYEDVPYAGLSGFTGWEAAPGPEGSRLAATYTDVSAVLERKVDGALLYATQVGPLFGSEAATRRALREYHARVADEGARASSDTTAGGEGPPVYAERSWRVEVSPAGTPFAGPGANGSPAPDSKT